MKIYLAQYNPDRAGGGWTFQSNFDKAMNSLITRAYDEADIYFIASPSMVQRDEVLKAKEDGKKIVLRIDNAVRNSRNRNTGMTRMKDFAEWADLVIFQSNWAFDYLCSYLYHPQPFKVILNGADLDLYKNVPGDPLAVLYSRFNRDETKNWEVARYWFSEYQREEPEAYLSIVGQFSPELINGNFDFYNNETFKHYGVTGREAMATMYQICGKFLYTYFNDACSNSLIEALVSGCEVVGDEYYRTTGGAPEILKAFYGHGRDYFSLERMANEYKQAMEVL